MALSLPRPRPFEPGRPVDGPISRTDRIRRVVELLQGLAREEGRTEIPLEARHLVAAPFGYVFRLGGHLGTPLKLQFSFRLEAGTPVVLSWTSPESEEQWFLSPSAQWMIQPLLGALIELVDGAAYELDYALAGSQPVFPNSTFLFPDGWWDQWKGREVNAEGETVGDAYRSEIYPWVQRWVERAFAPYEGPPLRVLDLCGGDGELLEGVLQVLPGAAEGVLVDRNRASCEAARARLGDRARVVQGDLRDLPRLLPELGPFDLVLSVGALNANVVTPDVAEAVAPSLVAALVEGGHFVAGGWTPCLLRAEDLRALGLEVLNSTRPAPFSVWAGQQLYGAVKGSLSASTTPSR